MQSQERVEGLQCDDTSWLLQGQRGPECRRQGIRINALMAYLIAINPPSSNPLPSVFRLAFELFPLSRASFSFCNHSFLLATRLASARTRNSSAPLLFVFRFFEKSKPFLSASARFLSPDARRPFAFLVLSSASTFDRTCSSASRCLR